MRLDEHDLVDAGRARASAFAPGPAVGRARQPASDAGLEALRGREGTDIITAGDGNDVTNGGANSNEHFLGSGDDFAIGGQGMDAIFGDSGDDWEIGLNDPQPEDTDLAQVFVAGGVIHAGGNQLITTVVAVNAVGNGQASARSNLVAGR